MGKYWKERAALRARINGAYEGEKENLEGWRGFLRHPKDRGLK
jgi:transposase-like protein